MLSLFQQLILSIPVGPYTITYTVLLALMFALPWRLGLKDSEWFKTKMDYYNKYVFWAHGILTFGILWVCEPRNLEPILGTIGVALDSSLARWVQQVLVSFLAIVLWDFGQVVSSELRIRLLINCHHIGAFLPVIVAPGWSIDTYLDSDEASRTILERQTSLDVRLFGWLWMIHSFGFLVKVVLPLIGVKLEKNSRSHSVDALKHAYALGSVYFFHQYMNYNAHRFFTYQTSSLLVMLTGRYLIFNNGMTLPFFRRVEFPGFWVVLLDRVLGLHDPACHRSLALVVGMHAAYIVYAVFIKRAVPVPERYFGPDDNPVLKKFLEDETSAVLGEGATSTPAAEAALAKFRSSRTFFYRWFSAMKTPDGRTIMDAYPLYGSVLACQPGNPADARALAKLLDDLDDPNDVNTPVPIPEFKGCTPLHFSAWNKWSYECTLLLLKRGANPYHENSSGRCAVQLGLRDDMRLSLLEPGSLGFSKGFWERFNAICLEKSPYKVTTKKQKFLKLLQLL
jgi:hypothetical protein